MTVAIRTFQVLPVLGVGYPPSGEFRDRLADAEGAQVMGTDQAVSPVGNVPAAFSRPRSVA